MKNGKKRNKQTKRNRCSTSRTFYISFHLCRSLPDKDTNWPNLRGHVEKATTRRYVDCEESLLSVKGKRVSGRNVPRERKRDAKGIPRVFRPLCLIPKARITCSIDDKCFPFFSRYVCAVHTSFFCRFSGSNICIPNNPKKSPTWFTTTSCFYDSTAFVVIKVPMKRTFLSSYSKELSKWWLFYCDSTLGCRVIRDVVLCKLDHFVTLQRGHKVV